MQTLLYRTRAELSLRSFSVREWLVLGTVTAFGLLLRAGTQWGRLFIGDEIATLTYMKKSTGYLLTHFGGQLTMNYFILAEKALAWLSGAIDWRVTLLPLAAAVAVISADCGGGAQIYRFQPHGINRRQSSRVQSLPHCLRSDDSRLFVVSSF